MQWRSTCTWNDAGYSLASDTAAYWGQVKNARELAEKSASAYTTRDQQKSGAISLSVAAQWQAAYGYPDRMPELAALALNLAPTSLGTNVEAAAAEVERIVDLIAVWSLTAGQVRSRGWVLLVRARCKQRTQLVPMPMRRKSARRVQGLPHALERCGFGHSHLQAGQGGVRQNQ